MNLDEKISEKYLDAILVTEHSWDSEKQQYTKRFEDEFVKLLTREEYDTGFAQMLILFGFKWYSDIIQICNRL